MAQRKTPRPPRTGVARFNIEILPKDLKALKQVAAKKGVTMTALIRPLIEKIIDKG